MTNELILLAINLTRRCNLACSHCYLDASTLKATSQGELRYDELCQLFDQLAQHQKQTLIVLTGGEPLIRHDLEAIIEYGSQLGLSIVVGTNGTMLTDSRVQALKQAGAIGVGISLDSLSATQHDAFRGVKGCWQKTINSLEVCRQHDLSFQIHFTITKDNRHELDAMIQFCKHQQARVLNIFFMVCTGRASDYCDLTSDQYDAILEQIIQAQQDHPDLIIRPRCAPHVKRVAYQLQPSALNRSSGQDGDGCIAGTHYCRIKYNGDVTPCPYIETASGNIRETSFFDLWQSNDLFQQLRTPSLRGACGQCEFQKLCGGCRARPVAAGAHIMAADSLCGYTPQGGAIIEPFATKMTTAMQWSDDATDRLDSIPAFLRSMIKKRVETYVEELGENQVQPEHLSALAAKRFGHNKMASLRK